MTLGNLTRQYQVTRKMSCFYRQGTSSLNTGAARFSEAMLPIYETTRCHIPEESSLHSQDHENLNLRRRYVLFRRHTKLSTIKLICNEHIRNGRGRIFSLGTRVGFYGVATFTRTSSTLVRRRSVGSRCAGMRLQNHTWSA